MRVLHAFNRHRSGGGATVATIALIDLLRGHGLEVEVIDRSSLDLPANVFGHLKAGLSAFIPGDSVREFRETLRRFRPALVHVHELFPLVSPWVLPECRKENIPVVMTCNDYHLTCPSRNHFRNGVVCTECAGGSVLPSILHNCRENLAESVTMAAYCAMVNHLRLYLDNVDHFIVPSAFARDWLMQHAGIDGSRITAVATQVPIPETPADPGLGRYAAFAGRFVPEKGIDVLLAAAELSGIPVELTRNRVSFVNVDLPSTAKIAVTDTRAELDSFYRGACMVVVPSVWFETFGLVAAEAMALGLPVIASRIGALAQLIEDGVDGLLFDTGRPQDLAAKMRLLWDDPELRRRLGSRARQKAIRCWRSEQHLENTLAIYDSVLQARTEPGRAAA